MKDIILKSACFLIALTLSVFLSNGSSSGAKRLVGAGATFPYPIYAKWAYKYAQETGVRLNYQSIGSGGGIQQIKKGTVDFGASDAPLNEKELEASGLVQFPMIIGGVVPVFHLKSVPDGHLRLSGEVLADIFLGKIKKWDDPRIRELNPGLDLPSRAITVVHRSDGSGTTWIFTSYLGKVSKEWMNNVGTGKAIRWPVGVGGKGNEGVAAYVKRINGAISYVEYAYAKQNRLSAISLKNREGNFVLPSSETFSAAAANADWEGTPGLSVILTDQPGHNSWPITGASFILMKKEQKDPDKAREVLKFFDWCFKNGKDLALSLDYIPVPEKVIALIERVWAESITANGKPIWVPGS